MEGYMHIEGKVFNHHNINMPSKLPSFFFICCFFISVCSGLDNVNDLALSI